MCIRDSTKRREGLLQNTGGEAVRLLITKSGAGAWYRRSEGRLEPLRSGRGRLHRGLLRRGAFLEEGVRGAPTERRRLDGPQRGRPFCVVLALLNFSLAPRGLGLCSFLFLGLEDRGLLLLGLFALSPQRLDVLVVRLVVVAAPLGLVVVSVGGPAPRGVR